MEGPLAVVGSAKLWVKMREAVGADRCPAESTVSEILRCHGLSRVAKRRGRAVPTEQPFKDCREANAVWCADFKGWFRTTNGRKCTPLTISDAHSRYLLCCQGLGGATAQPPRAHLGAQQKAFEAFRREYNEERPHEALGQRPPAVF